jgi:hypothetical protein
MNPSDISYQMRDDAPGKYFQCSRYGLLSIDACSRNFAAAPGLKAEGRLSGCIGCPVGVVHAGGQEAVSAPSTSLESGSALSSTASALCSRCRRNPTDASKYRSTRQGKVRLVRDGELCVSCYNRGREVEKGKNARGTRPRLELAPVVTVYAKNNDLKVMSEAVAD